MTTVTKEAFYAWKETMRLKREKSEDKRASEEKKSGKPVENLNLLTGRQIFVVDKNLFEDDD